jgi:anti-sigma factor RsiW
VTTTAEDREPTRLELEAMAYVDGELALDARRAVEARLASDPALRGEVVRLQRLALLARDAAGPEPADAEWAALARDPLQRAGMWLGFAALGAGLAALAAFGLHALWTAESALALKVGASLVALGVLALFGAALRARMRTRPYDPYTEVRR